MEKGEGTSHARSQQAHAIKPHPQTIVISFLGFRLYWDEAQRRQHARPGAGGQRERPRGAAGRGGPALSFRSRPPYSPSPGPACRAAQAAPLDGFPGEAGAAAGRGGVERRRAGAGSRAPLFRGPSFQPLREGCSSRGPETLPGEAGGARCRPRLFKGSAGSATAQPANPAGAETLRRGRVGSCSSLLLFGLFFLERIKAATQPKLEALSIFLTQLCLLSVYHSTFLIGLIRSALQCR